MDIDNIESFIESETESLKQNKFDNSFLDTQIENFLEMELENLPESENFKFEVKKKVKDVLEDPESMVFNI